jgi:hypothetical protein
MTILPCSTTEERQKLVLIQETIQQLNMDPSKLGRHSSANVIVMCPVCQKSFTKEFKRFLDGKGRTCSKECQSILRCNSQSKAKSIETEEKKQQRISKMKKNWANKSEKEIQEITEKRRATFRTERGVDWITQDPEVQRKMSIGVQKAYRDPAVLEKRFNTNLTLYGHTNYLASLEGQKKVKQHNQKTLGVNFPFEDPKFQAEARKITQEKYNVDNIRHLPGINERIADTCTEKYGTNNPSKVPEFREKSKQTSLERYGTEYPTQNKEVQEKAKKSLQNRYGVSNPYQIPEVREKAKSSTKEKFGVEHALQSPEVQEKIIKNNMERYGVEHPLQSPEIQQKIVETNLERYGVEHISQSPEIHEKARNSNLDKYGVEYWAQHPDNRNKLKEWCDENPDKVFTSGPERSILEWIQIFYPNAKKYRDGTHEIDIFIPEINFGIEHNGLYHHQEDILDNRHGPGTGKRYHINKTRYFKEKNIRIIHIFEHEWRDRKGQVKSFLLSAIGKNEHKIGARKCQVLWSGSLQDIQEVHKFLETYHIQGAPNYNTEYVVKVLYDNEILAVATFGKHHRNNTDWVLTRFCTKMNYTIQGVLSRISKLASQQLRADILSWADYRLSVGNGYEKAGWIFEELLPPDYFYHKSGKVISKQARQKRIVGTPENMTEREHAEADGLHRVYDCGKIRYRYKWTK